MPIVHQLSIQRSLIMVLEVVRLQLRRARGCAQRIIRTARVAVRGGQQVVHLRRGWIHLHGSLTTSQTSINVSPLYLSETQVDVGQNVVRLEPQRFSEVV